MILLKTICSSFTHFLTNFLIHISDSPIYMRLFGAFQLFSLFLLSQIHKNNTYLSDISRILPLLELALCYL